MTYAVPRGDLAEEASITIENGNPDIARCAAYDYEEGGLKSLERRGWDAEESAYDSI